MPVKLPRLRFSDEHCRALSEARKGKTHSPETKAKIAAALKGRKHSLHTIELMRTLRNRRPKATPERIIEECRAIAKEKRRSFDLPRRRNLRADIATARFMGDAELEQDLRRSGGWFWKRTIFDPTGRVSNGFTKTDGVLKYGQKPTPPHVIAKRKRERLKNG